MFRVLKLFSAFGWRETMLWGFVSKTLCIFYTAICCGFLHYLPFGSPPPPPPTPPSQLPLRSSLGQQPVTQPRLSRSRSPFPQQPHNPFPSPWQPTVPRPPRNLWPFPWQISTTMMPALASVRLPERLVTKQNDREKKPGKKKKVLTKKVWKREILESPIFLRFPCSLICFQKGVPRCWQIWLSF